MIPMGYQMNSQQVARLQELTATLEQLNEKVSRDYELLRVEAERVKSSYEKESRSAASTVKSLEGQLSAEQIKNAQSIAKLQEDLKAKENEMSKLESTAPERSRTIADMKQRLEEYSRESERTVEEHKRKIAAMSASFEKELARDKAAHEAQLKQVEAKLQNEIQSLQRDLNSRSDMIADLKTKLDASTKHNKKISVVILGLDDERRTIETSLKQSARDLDVAKQEVGRLQNKIQHAQQLGVANGAQIQALQSELDGKTKQLKRLSAGADQFASEKERLLVDLDALARWKDSAQSSINNLSNEVALNALPGGGSKIDDVIAKLSGIRDELRQRDAQIVQAKSAAKALLEKGEGRSQSQPSVSRMGETQSMPRSRPAAAAGTVIGGNFLARNAAPSVDVIGGGFSTRKRNIAQAKPTLASSSSLQGSGGVLPERNTAKTNQVATAGVGKGATASLRPTPSPVVASSATPKPQSSGTMSAYDAALKEMQKKMIEKAQQKGSMGP